MNDQQAVQENAYKDYYIKVQEQYIGEFLGKIIDLEAKLALYIATNKTINEKLADLSATEEQNVSLQQRIEIIESNKKAFETQNEELKEQLNIARKDRQLAQEELANMKLKKRGRPRKSGD